MTPRPRGLSLGVYFGLRTGGVILSPPVALRAVAYAHLCPWSQKRRQRPPSGPGALDLRSHVSEVGPQWNGDGPGPRRRDGI